MRPLSSILRDVSHQLIYIVRAERVNYNEGHVFITTTTTTTNIAIRRRFCRKQIVIKKIYKQNLRLHATDSQLFKAAIVFSMSSKYMNTVCVYVNKETLKLNNISHI